MSDLTTGLPSALVQSTSAAEFGQALDDALSRDQSGSLLAGLRRHSLLSRFFPELARCDGFDQRSPWHPEGDLYTHIDNVYRRTCQLTDDTDLRWVAILHDLGKPESFWVGSDGFGHYYASRKLGKEAHEIVGARIARHVLRRFELAPPRILRIADRVRWHMRRPTAEASIARMIDDLGRDAFADLVLFSVADHESDGDPGEYSRSALRTAALIQRRGGSA